jgi:IS5 family transposase
MLGTESSQAHLTATAAFCSTLLEPGSLYHFLQEHRREIFADAKFAHLYPSGTGRPSIPASRVASVMVLQTLEGLSDREALEQVRYNLRWKLALGLDLEDRGFDPSVLTYWRNRIKNSNTPNLIFDLAREIINETKILNTHTKRVLDSTVLVDAVITEDSMSQIVAQIKRTQKLIPALGEVPLSREIDYSRRKPAIDYSDRDLVNETLSILVSDANALIDRARALGYLSDDADSPLDPQQLGALGLLGVVAGQDVELVDETTGAYRLIQGVAKDRVISTVDPESRHVHKSRKNYHDGYKGHIAIDADTEIITSATLTKGNASDAEVAKELLDQETESVTLYGDSGYSSMDLSKHLADKGHGEVIKPRPLTMAVPGGYSVDDFIVREATNDTPATVTCPAEHCVPISAKGRASFVRYCATCPLKEHCTRSKRGRVMNFPPNHSYARTQRERWGTEEIKAEYQAIRPGVERIHAQMKRKLNGSKLRYRGLAKNTMHYLLLGAVWNLKVLLRNNLTRENGSWVLAN